MSGHSQWSQSQRQKAANDAKRGQLYTKIGREITVAVQDGGPDPSGNFRLEQALAKARAANMPKDTIERSIQRGAGGGPGEGASLIELTYEAYGPAGVGLLIEVVTDNRNRAVAEVRNAVGSLGGTFADSGSVAWQFEARGNLAVAVGDADPEEIELMAIDAGALDVEAANGTVHVSTPAADLARMRRELSDAGYQVTSADLIHEPTTPMPLESAKAAQAMRMAEALEELDDVQRVYTTLEISDDLLAQIAS